MLHRAFFCFHKIAGLKPANNYIVLILHLYEQALISFSSLRIKILSVLPE